MFKKIFIILVILMVLVFIWSDFNSFIVNMFGDVRDLSTERDYNVVVEENTPIIVNDEDEINDEEPTDETLVEGTIVVDGLEYEVSKYLSENSQQNYYCIDDAKLYDDYMKILFASILGGKREIEVSGLSVDMIKKYTDDIFNIIVQTEYMMLFDGFEWLQSGNTVSDIKLLYDDEAVLNYEESKKVCNKISNEIFSSDMDDIQKAKAAYDYLIINTEYSEKAADYVNCEDIPEELATAFESYGAFVESKAVCQGYAYAFNMLLETQGIESRYVKSDSLNHGWSMIEIDGNWYHCDLSYDDPIPDRKGVANHKFFLKNDAYMSNFESARLEDTQNTSNANNYNYEIYDFEFYIVNDVSYVYRLEGDTVVRYHVDGEDKIDYSSKKTVVGDVLSWHDMEDDFSFLYTQKSDGDLYKIYFDGRNAVRLVKKLDGYIVEVNKEQDEIIVTLVDGINGNKSIVTIN